MPEGYTAITLASGENNRVFNNFISPEWVSEAKIVIKPTTKRAIVTGSVFEQEIQNEGDNSHRVALLVFE